MCEFCEKFDFSTARLDVRKDIAHIELALCNTRFPKEQQFKYCPVCGANLNENKINYDRIRNMSVEEMAEFMYETNENCENFCTFTKNGKCNVFEGGRQICIMGIKQYLESEVTE